ncbi:hypothetical protein FisN_19Lh010 [Fistulifera solaris]|uniref:Uncharacterized protein n=1 Tax=Fistulifera solaris TaxID=1519565 RepID=A0A1Z5JQY3_FISSO|nr:hypothetical protein FisN_19Lh010 [Fistulifera solaris]|eukprot:GAX16433.1 hypothetical protein FisN_19Lh010 [Fistulifera solaris]
MSSSTAETKPDESDRIDGSNAYAGDQLHGNDRKRSRPTGRGEGSQKNSNNLEDADEGAQEYHQTSEDGRPKIATRARGSSGIPPRGKLELEDLQGMSEDEVMRALYEDPELAAAAAAAADKSGFGSSNTAGQTGIPKLQTVKRVDGLKERGFPFVQWAVLLLLLGLATHQIYKSMLTPSATKSRSKKTSKAKNGKAVKNSSVKNKATEDAKEIEEELLVTETEVIPPAKQSASEKSSPSMRKKKVKTKKTKVASSTTQENGTTFMSQTKSAIMETSNHDDGWTTVGKESDPKPKAEAKNGSSQIAIKIDASVAVSEKNKAPTGTNEFQPVATKPKKKNKNKKKQENGASTNHDNAIEQINGIEEDAALAMELQKYEERALASESIESNVDVWEEVKPKKRK